MNNPDLTNITDYYTLLQKRVELSPDETFWIEAITDTKITFKEFSECVNTRYAWLLEQGVKPGDVAVWQMPTGIEAYILCFALSYLGAIQVPVINLYRETELTAIIGQAKPAFWFVDAEGDSSQVAEKTLELLPTDFQQPQIVPISSLGNKIVEPIPPAPHKENDVRWYYFTSGTTGLPKGARHGDLALIKGGQFLGGKLNLGPDDVGSVAFPVAHIGGMTYATMTLTAGSSAVLLAHYEPEWAAEIFRRYNVNLGGGSTAHYQILLEQQRKQPGEKIIPSLKIMCGGGAAKPAALFHSVKEELGVTIVHAYGMTEAPICCSNTINDTDEQLANTDGVIMPGLELKIVDPEGNFLPQGESGEIWLRGPNLCHGYLNEEQTKAAFDENGFYHTGDLGRIREDNRLCVTGRLKDIIIRKGENIPAVEVEDILNAHPKVKESAVIGLPDEKRGEMVCAVIELEDPQQVLTMDEMAAFFIEKNVMRQKIPERLEIVDQFPRNPGLQKIQKPVLRERYSN